MPYSFQLYYVKEISKPYCHSWIHVYVHWKW